jgi:hypothetical protein
LVKFAEVTPKSFVCKGEPTKKAFKASEHIANFEDEDAWDFGPSDWGNNIGPYNHCSYSYHQPYNQCFLSLASSEPGMAVAADRNPHLDWYTNPTGFEPFKAGKNLDGIKFTQLGNASAHQREGQNVLFMDNHVYFEKLSYCGVDEDNIYTTWNPSAKYPKEQGAPPACGVYDTSVPTNRKDSLLVNECGPGPQPTIPPQPPQPPVPPPPPPIP